MDKSYQILQEKNIRPSQHRVQVLKYLRGVRTHPSVDMIYSFLEKSNPNLSRTTIYNIVELFAEKGVILSLDFGEGFLRYDGCTLPHSHFKCTTCGRIYDISGIPENWETIIPEGFTVRSSAFIFRGICKKCSPLPKTPNSFIKSLLIQK